jgi:hypothetical protein
MTKRDFENWAVYISGLNHSDAVAVAIACVRMFREKNPQFDRCRFLHDCGFTDPEYTELMHITM